MASERRVPVSEGGFWNTQPVNYSNGTQKLLRDMMQESRLTNLQQRQINEKLRNGNCLPPPPTSVKSRPGRNPAPQKTPKILNPRNYSGGMRTRSMIEESGAYQKSDFKPAPVRGRTETDKDRLANIMAYGEDCTPLGSGSMAGARSAGRQQREQRSPSPEISDTKRFDELVNEIEERRTFLEQMESLGQGKKYQTIIETEISKLLREMEVIDRKKCAEMERMQQTQKLQHR